MITVLSYLWSDPSFANKYGPDDVRLLQRMVSRHLTIPHRFAVVTDCPEAFSADADIMAIPIDWTKHVPRSCFVRLYTFSAMLGTLLLGGPVLQLDLDTVIVGNLDEIASRSEPLVLWRNPARIPWDNPARAGRPYYNGSIMLHHTSSREWVWELFMPERRQHAHLSPGHGPYRDDQWLYADLFGPDMPYFDGERDGVYRLARSDTPGSGVWGALPANARIVTFPGSEGKPTNPLVLKDNPWIAEHRC